MADKDDAPVQPEEFDASFDEFASKHDEPGGTPVEAEEVEEGDDASPDVQAEADQAEADQAEADQADAADDEDAQDQGPSREELIAERDRYKQMVSSDRGRVSAMQKQINELKAALEKKQAAPEPEEAEDEDPDDLKEFSEDYPDIDSAMKKRLKTVLEREREALRREFHAHLDPIIEERQQREATEATEFVTMQSSQVEEFHAGWEKTVQSPEFSDWFAKQTPGIQGLAASDHAPDAVTLLDKFKRDTGFTEPANKGDGEPKTEDDDDEEQDEAAKLAARRASQRKASTALPASRLASRQEAAQDFDRAFDEFARKQDARLQQHR